jgi:hypothetical protein
MTSSDDWDRHIKTEIRYTEADARDAYNRVHPGSPLPPPTGDSAGWTRIENLEVTTVPTAALDRLRAAMRAYDADEPHDIPRAVRVFVAAVDGS